MYLNLSFPFLLVKQNKFQGLQLEEFFHAIDSLLLSFLKMFLAKRNKGKEKGTSFSCSFKSSALFLQAGCTRLHVMMRFLKRSLKWCGKFELLTLHEMMRFLKRSLRWCGKFELLTLHEMMRFLKRSLKWCGKFELLKLQENEKTIDNGGEGTNRWTKKYFKR